MFIELICSSQFFFILKLHYFEHEYNIKFNTTNNILADVKEINFTQSELDSKILH